MAFIIIKEHLKNFCNWSYIFKTKYLGSSYWPVIRWDTFMVHVNELFTHCMTVDYPEFYSGRRGWDLSRDYLSWSYGNGLNCVYNWVKKCFVKELKQNSLK